MMKAATDLSSVCIHMLPNLNRLDIQHIAACGIYLLHVDAHAETSREWREIRHLSNTGPHFRRDRRAFLH